MTPSSSSTPISSRREFLKTSGRLAAASALAGMTIPHVHAQGSGAIQLGLVGSGGRGAGAARDAMSTRHGPTRLVAMGDVMADRLQRSTHQLRDAHEAQFDVPPDRQFMGIDAYRKVMDCLKPGDVVILTSPPAFRWVHFAYAIKKRLNVFMEKPVTVDGPTSKRMLELSREADAANLKVGVGLMSRHSRPLQELRERVQNGELGEIITMRGYRMHGPVGFFASTAPSPGENEFLYQMRRFHSFLWSGGGAFSDFYIHIIDHLSWIKNALPVRALASGGRHYRFQADGTPFVDQNFDVYSVEYVYEDGCRLHFEGRSIEGCYANFSSRLHGTKGMAIASRQGDCGPPSTIFKGQAMRRSNLLWQSDTPPEEQNPYQNEWNALMQAIRNDQPFNEIPHGVQASLITSMGRMAAHTGQEITYEDMLNCEHEFAPGLDKLTLESPAPLQADASGRYPVPEPGIKRDREY